MPHFRSDSHQLLDKKRGLGLRFFVFYQNGGNYLEEIRNKKSPVRLKMSKQDFS